MNPDDDDTPQTIKEPRLWQDYCWTARVIKNEDDEGGAVAMSKIGASEPALIGPWTIGRDKKNPKPLDTNAFHTLVKTASEFVRRQEQQEHARLHQSVTVTAGGGRWQVNLDIVPDDDDPHALLSAVDAAGQTAARRRVAASFKLNARSAQSWIEGGFGKPA